MPRRDRKGFTLLELMLAVTLSAMLLLAGRSVFEQVAAAGRGVSEQASGIDSSATRAARLRSLFRNVEVGTDTTITFTGDGQKARFTSWCPGRETVMARCEVTLSVDTALVATVGGHATMLARDTVAGTLRYLGDVRDGGRWLRTWGPSFTAPLAVGVLFGTDTTVLRIGARG